MSISSSSTADRAKRGDILRRYRAARDYIDRELVRLEPRRRDPEAKVRTARAFNARLGNPQRACPAVQVAGTSGKGTVTALIGETLRAAGLRAGYHVSPYLQAFTEKTWIDGRYLSVDGLEAAVAELRPVADAFAADPDGPASVHGLASLAASYLAFREARLDLAVIETGLGGRYDLVQGLDRELSVITDLGLDHTRALGPTLEEIAWHKAGIIERGVPCVAVRGAGWEVIEREAREVAAPLVPVEVERVLAAAGSSGRSGAAVELRLPHLGTVRLRLADGAPFLARNAAVAAVALDTLAARGWPIRPRHLVEGFRVRLPGRFERVASRPRVILDGAHNPQKITALVDALRAGEPAAVSPLRPAVSAAAGGDDRRPDLTVLLTATGGRLPEELLAALAPLAGRLVVTQLDLYGKSTVPAVDLATAASRLGLDAVAVPEPEAALDRALHDAGPAETVLVTGSIYLVGRLRDRWYPTDEVVLQRSSWPSIR